MTQAITNVAIVKTVQHTARIPGPQGPSVIGAIGFNFTQSAPADVWTISHNLGYKPSVSVMNAGGVEIEAEVAHLSNNTAQVTFNEPVAGLARLV